MLPAQRRSAAPSRNQVSQGLVGHWTKGKRDSKAEPSRLNSVDPGTDTLIWVWSLQSSGCGKKTRPLDAARRTIAVTLRGRLRRNSYSGPERIYV